MLPKKQIYKSYLRSYINKKKRKRERVRKGKSEMKQEQIFFKTYIFPLRDRQYVRQSTALYIVHILTLYIA